MRKNAKEFVSFVCVHCGKMKVIDKAEYRRRTQINGVEPRFCSKPCVHEGRKADTARRASSGDLKAITSLISAERRAA